MTATAPVARRVSDILTAAKIYPKQPTDAPPPSKRSKSEKRHARQMLEELEGELEALAGTGYVEFENSIVIEISDAAMEWVAQMKDGPTKQQYVRAVEQSPGRYWKIAYTPRTYDDVENADVTMACWRQEAAPDDAPNNKQLFLYWDACHGGWVLGETLKLSGNVDNDNPPIGWGYASKTTTAEAYPDTLHFPWSERRSFNDVVGDASAVVIMPYHEWASTQLAKPSSSGMGGGVGGDGKGGGSTGGDHSKGDGKRKEAKRSGWKKRRR